MSGLKEVELVSTGVFLPGDPVPFDKIEEIIGHIDQGPAKVKALADRLRPLANNLLGVEQCYFAIDPETKEFTENNVSMTVKAIRAALKKANAEPQEIELIAVGIAVPEYQVPPLSALVQGELGIERCTEMEIHSNCTGITKAFQIAYDGIRTGRYKTAVIAYSQFSSPYLVARHYNQSKLKAENLLLRWFLSDGASAVVLKARDKVGSGIRVNYVYNESLGGKMDPAMWLHLGSKNYDLLKAYQEGTHHLGQDYGTVNKMAPSMGVECLKRMLALSGTKSEEVGHILASIPSDKLIGKAKELAQSEFGIASDKWFSNVHKKGYCGGSSIIIGLDEMISKKIFKAADLLACLTIESSKWMVGGFLLEYL